MKQTYLICAIASILMLSLAGCKKEEPVQTVPVLTPTGEEIISVPADGGDYSITYKLDDPVDGGYIQVSFTGNDDEWIFDVDDEQIGTVSFSVNPNTGTEPRNATLTVSYVYLDGEPLTFDTKIEQAGTAEEPEPDPEEYNITVSVNGNGTAVADKETAEE